MEIFKKRKIVPVRTHDKEAPLLKNTYINPEHGNPWVLSNGITNPIERGYEFYHLHILSNEMGKEGDWVVDLDYNPPLIFKADEEYTEVGFQAPKIIATTDKSLILYDSETLASAPGFKLSTEPICLPWISQDLIEYFCVSDGLKEVMVKYLVQESCECAYESRDCKSQALTEDVYCRRFEPEEYLEVSPSGFVTTKPAKDNWNREEMESLLDKLFWWKHYNPNMEDKDFLKWIKETL